PASARRDEWEECRGGREGAAGAHLSPSTRLSSPDPSLPPLQAWSSRIAIKKQEDESNKPRRTPQAAQRLQREHSDFSASTATSARAQRLQEEQSDKPEVA